MKRGHNRDYLWNTLAGLINAAEAVIMSMIVTRTAGLTDAGYLTLAFAVGNLLLSVGKYGVYNYQVTDLKNEFSLRTYAAARLITVFAMILFLAGYLFRGTIFYGNTPDKTRIILFIGLIYAVESLEDLVKGYCQKKGRLYIGAALFTARWTGILISFGLAEYLSECTDLSLGIALGISVPIFFAGCKRIFIILPLSEADKIRESETRGIKDLIVRCFPLFLNMFLAFYVSNSAKYALEIYDTAEVQACYGFVAMPVFAIGLLNGFIYQPQLVNMTDEYQTGKTDLFRQRLHRQYLWIGILTVICVAGAYWIGIPVLSFLYHTDLTGYLRELLILVLSGGFLALSGYQAVILTIMRRQETLLWGYLPVAVIAFAGVGAAVRVFGTTGAAASYLILMILLCIIYGVFIYRTPKKEEFLDE